MTRDIPARHMLDANGNVCHWWAALSAVPLTPDCPAYERLRRVWFDHTRFHGSRDEVESHAVKGNHKSQARYHEFVKPNHETNLTVTLWENFSLFRAQDWLPRLYIAAGLDEPATPVDRCSWNYEWVGRIPGGKIRQPMCDVVVEYEDVNSGRSVLVVEAKALGKLLGRKDADTGYYMEIPEIAAYRDRASLLYLIDEACRPKIIAQLGPLQPRVGLLSWQELGALQIELALRLETTDAIRSFIAGAIQYQFAQHNIRPSRLAAAYLEQELSMTEIDALPPGSRQSMALHYEPTWRLPEHQVPKS